MQAPSLPLPLIPLSHPPLSLCLLLDRRIQGSFDRTRLWLLGEHIFLSLHAYHELLFPAAVEEGS